MCLLVNLAKGPLPNGIKSVVYDICGFVVKKGYKAYNEICYIIERQKAFTYL